MDIEVWEEQEEGNEKEPHIIEQLDKVRDYLVENGGKLSKEAKKAFEDILHDHSNRIKAGLVAMAMGRFEQIASLTRKMDSIEKEVDRRLTDRDEEGNPTIRRVNLKDLAIMYRALADREKTVINFMDEVASGGMPEKLEERLEMADLEEGLAERGVNGIPEPESREKVVKLLQRLVEKG